MLRSLRKNENNVSDKSYIATRAFTKVTPVIKFTDGPVIQCNVSVAENTFVDD